MNLNFQVHLSLLDIEPIKGLKGNTKLATWITMNMIAHFTRVNGSCQLPKNQLAQAWGIRKSFFSDATKILIDCGWIKELKAYDRKTNSAAWYATAPGWVSGSKKLVLWEPKAGAVADQEKEFKINSKQKKNDFVKSSSSLNGMNAPENPEKQFKFPKYN